MHMRRTLNKFCPTESLTSRSIHLARKDALKKFYECGFSYSRKLTAHKSCVNYLAFSRHDGRWLASAGDDCRVLLWDFSQEDVVCPMHAFAGPMGNVLTLDFSATNQYLYSGGADDVILKYDVSTLREVGSTSIDERDWSFSVEREDGKLVLHDSRAGGRMSAAQGTLQHTAAFTGAQHHPVMEHVFATCDVHGHVCLRDTRMTFGPLSRRSNGGIVRVYNTKLSRKSTGYLSNPESSSLTFDRDGEFWTTSCHYFPTIYAMSDPHPLAICTGRNTPDGTPISPPQRSYTNSCTMKSGAFGGPGMDEDDMYGAGSDDFRAYVWRIPPLMTLQGLRQEITSHDWYAREWPDTVVLAFAEGKWESRYVPHEISMPLARLNGHKSIVNSVAIHPSLLHIATSGVERQIILHSPTPSSPAVQNLLPTSPTVRMLQPQDLAAQRTFLRALFGPHPTLHEDVEDDEGENETISLFDHILRAEGEADVFTIRRWGEDSEEDSEDEDETIIDVFDTSLSDSSL
ncbi:WD40 repeat-like protein [Suillus discolor]|uniref:WD40 repeat-like protein n=1 Tax=Suillus discolor TaxID=1912936 RepID=A0A9P7F1U2_9AGAM|nr:WD40 repeat-like protein [Suillus discolor]KAG2101108.1 WD40 repeat-like protein [Suillus discolor]